MPKRAAKSPDDSMRPRLLGLIAGRRGHFRMESGLHSEWWFELGQLFDRPERVQPYVAELARRLAAHGVDAICGPMTGGAKLAEMIATELKVAFLFTERFEPPRDETHDGFFRIKYEVPNAMRETARGKSVAIVDDAISAGSAVRGTYDDVVACGARPVALGALFILGDGIVGFAAENNLAVEAVARLPFEMWKPDACPLCAAKVRLEKLSDVI